MTPAARAAASPARPAELHPGPVSPPGLLRLVIADSGSFAGSCQRPIAPRPGRLPRARPAAAQCPWRPDLPAWPLQVAGAAGGAVAVPGGDGSGAEQLLQPPGQRARRPGDLDDLVPAGRASNQRDMRAWHPEGVCRGPQRGPRCRASGGPGGDADDQGITVAATYSRPRGTWLYAHCCPQPTLVRAPGCHSHHISRIRRPAGTAASAACRDDPRPGHGLGRRFRGRRRWAARRHGHRQRVGNCQQAAARAHEPPGRPARPGRPGGPSPPRSGLARLPLCRGGTGPVNAESFTPGRLLNARPVLTLPAATVPPAPRGAPRAGPGQTPSIYRNPVFEVLFHFLTQIRYQRGKIRRLLLEFHIPSLYLSWSFRIPAIYVGPPFRRSRPSPGGGLPTVASHVRRGLEAEGARSSTRGRGSCPCPGDRVGARRASGPAGVQRLRLRHPERRRGGREQRRQRAVRTPGPLPGDIPRDRGRHLESTARLPALELV